MENDLEVDGNLTYDGTFTGWSINDEITLTSETTIDLGVSSSEGICFLTRMKVDHESCDPGAMECWVKLDNNNWKLYNNEGGGCVTNTDCAARCIIFAGSE